MVSHDRHFLNTVCTNIVDVDYGGIKMYVGNYEFWCESSQMMQRLIQDQNKKEEKIRLQEFVSRFSASKSKSKQATARRKLLDKLTVERCPPPLGAILRGLQDGPGSRAKEIPQRWRALPRP